MLNQINLSVFLSKISERTLIIDCNSGCFKDDFNRYFKILNFEYFTSYDVMEKEDYNNIIEYINSSVKYKNNKYFLIDRRVNLNKDEITKETQNILFFTYLNGVNYYKDWNITVNVDILDKIKKYEVNEEYIGIHFRNTDCRHDLNKIVSRARSIKNIDLVYFSTDDFLAYDLIKKLLPEKQIIRNTIPYNGFGKNIHYSNPDKGEVVLNTLIDMYCLSKSKIFIPSEKSSMSKRILEIRKYNNFFI